jgi:phosphopentomutase
MTSAKRAILIVMDGCGAGEAPDAPAFKDLDHPATVRHVWERCGPLKVPNLAKFGFLAACGIESSPRTGRFGRLREISQGKDSVTGHWEMMGIITPTPFPTYPDGFPIPLVKEFERRIGTQTLGDRASSGTEIIDQLGPLHMETGFPILYTSADSVFQVACHEDVVPIERLYEICRIGREVCVAPDNVQRVIARPFVGTKGAFERTGRRKDFPVAAPPNLVDEVCDVYGVGVVPELFGGRGFREVGRTQSNAQHAAKLMEAMDSDARFIFANFEDFDMLYGHRNDPVGFGRCLESFDQILGQIVEKLGPGDLLLLTADHGNDPTTASTDHSREYVPVCLIGESVQPQDLGDVEGITAIGATIAVHLDVAWPIGKALGE